MKLLAMVTDPAEVSRDLAHSGEPTDVPARSPSRGRPSCRGTVRGRRLLGGLPMAQRTAQAAKGL
jgi:hypothetical protein